jgi:hypothetical protein
LGNTPPSLPPSSILEVDFRYHVSAVGSHITSPTIILVALDIIDRPAFYLKHNVSDTGFCLRLQVKPTQTETTSFCWVHLNSYDLFGGCRQSQQFLFLYSPFYITTCFGLYRPSSGEMYTVVFRSYYAYNGSVFRLYSPYIYIYINRTNIYIY